jgi:urease accessory protein UreF
LLLLQMGLQSGAATVATFLMVLGTFAGGELLFGVLPARLATVGHASHAGGRKLLSLHPIIDVWKLDCARVHPRVHAAAAPPH